MKDKDNSELTVDHLANLNTEYPGSAVPKEEKKRKPNLGRPLKAQHRSRNAGRKSSSLKVVIEMQTERLP